MSEDDFPEICDEIDSVELTDLAFGMFTIFVEQQLEKKGTCLYKEVEEGRDLTDLCDALFQEFCAEYEVLNEPLAFIGPGNMVAILYAQGEGIVPTKTVRSYWIQQDRPGTTAGAASAEEAGKWLIFLPPEEVDEAWQKVRNATAEGRLGIGAKVSTAKENEDSHDDRKVIYVFTENWADEADVMRVREELKTLGFADRIGYKRNLDTYAGEYREKGKRVAYYSV